MKSTMTKVDTRQLGFLYRLLVWDELTEDENSVVVHIIKNKEYSEVNKLRLNDIRKRFISNTE